MNSGAVSNDRIGGPDGPRPEEIAALFGGSLSEDERAEILDRVGRSAAATSVYAESLALKRSFAGPRWSRLVLPFAAAAAVILFAMTVPLPTRQPSVTIATASDLVASIDATALEAAMLSSYEPAFPAFRGTARPGSAEGGAFQLGVHLVNVEAHAASDQSAEAGRRVSQMTQLLDAMEAQSPLRLQYRAISDGLTSGSDLDLASARVMAEGDLGDWVGTLGELATLRFEFGKHLEAMRLGVVGGDLAFLRTDEARSGLARIDELGLRPASLEAAAEFLTLVDSTESANEAFVAGALNLLDPIFREAAGR